MLDLWRLDELRGIARDGRRPRARGAHDVHGDPPLPALREHAPALVEAAATIGAAQIQNRGTLGGNTMNASPAGDTLPVLLALDAELVVGGLRGERMVPASAFWPAYRRTAALARRAAPARPDPDRARPAAALPEGRHAAGTGDPKVVMALAWRQEGDGAEAAWRDVRLALGSVAPTPIRAAATEALLEGAAPTAETAERAVAALAAELHPIDDVRSTAAYRGEVARRVLHRLLRDAGGW